MKLSQFKFDLPEEFIAKHPSSHRDEARLMVVHRNSDKLEHRVFKDVLDYFMKKTSLSLMTPRSSLHAYLGIKRKQVLK